LTDLGRLTSRPKISGQLLTLVVLVARQMLLQVAGKDIGQVTDF
jgi:hypothetical protein